MRYTISVSYIDTCASGYIQDHHTRDGELLVGVLVDGLTTIREMREGVLSEVYAIDFNIPDGVTSVAIEAALAGVLPLAKDATLFDASLGDAEEDEEQPIAWWLLQWGEDDEA